MRLQRFLNSFSNPPTAVLLFCVGLFLRVIYTCFFSHFFAENYLNTNSVLYDGKDFGAWLTAFKSLISNGNFTADANHPYGYFGRMPGYSFFIGFFYVIIGKAYYLYVLVALQVLMDSLNIILLYHITKKIFPHSAFIFVPALLYAIHPINIIWAPVLMSECLSLFLMIIGFYYLIVSSNKWNYAIAGSLFGFNILVRPQVAVLTLVIGCVLLMRYLYLNRSTILLKQLLTFSVFVCLLYGTWPVRNYWLHDKILFSHDIRGMKAWSIDVYGYMWYNFSIQTNWDPQFSQIVKNQDFTINKQIAYAAPSDSIDLARAIYLSKNCGSGFSNWPNYWKNSVTTNNCDTVIFNLFLKLRAHQIQYNGWHYWVTLPLKNLQKCFFKNDLTVPGKSLIYNIMPLAFLFRTIILILGLIGCVYLILQKRPYRYFFIICISFFISWYGSICFGPGANMRNIEMRYLMQADNLLIIPIISFFIFFEKRTLINKKKTLITSEIRQN